MKPVVFILLALFTFNSNAQSDPEFGNAIDVTIQGLTFDAMETFISHDGEILYFNSVNDGVDTKIYYATRIDDDTFKYIGELGGVNQTTQPYLDAVADADSIGNFYWTSTRDYPAQLNNLHHGTLSGNSVINIERVNGDFNKNIEGWLVMDHGISANGELLYFNNARFDDNTCTGACETEMGIAEKVNSNTFNVTANSATILANVNDQDYIYYAPCISYDNLELYYTRYLKGPTASTDFDVCVATRASETDAFGQPKILFSENIATLIEAVTITKDKSRIYYHQKTSTSHKVLMRYRTNLVSTLEINLSKPSVYPNPASTILNVKTKSTINLAEVINPLGQIVLSKILNSNSTELDITNLEKGIYTIRVSNDKAHNSQSFVKQ